MPQEEFKKHGRVAATSRLIWQNKLSARKYSTSYLKFKLVPLSTLPAERIAPLLYNRLSVTIVFPASTCANIPRLIIFIFIYPPLANKKTPVMSILSSQGDSFHAVFFRQKGTPKNAVKHSFGKSNIADRYFL
ncbi:hypothetical protein DOT_3278 [Desulfosporosinus sp. OT]|nr:hypothetical protein DOT_3278 [Desulfosporosinus sp. OT]